MKTAEFLRGMVCDDIRQEFDGRYNLLGVISGPIVFITDELDAEDPNHRLAFYIEVKSYKDTPIHFRFIKEGSEKPLVQSSGTLRHEGDKGEPDWGVIPLGPRDFSFEQSGTYWLQGKFGKGVWKNISPVIVRIEKPYEGASTIK